MSLLSKLSEQRISLLNLVVNFFTLFVLSSGAVVAYNSWSTSLENTENARVAQLYERLADVNRQIFSDPRKQAAINIFLGLENTEMISARKKIEDAGEFTALYWGARAVHLNHINLLGQAWVLAGRSEEEFKKKFPGWIDLAKAVMRDLKHSHSDNSAMPEWYRKACSDMYPLNVNFIYGRDFLEMLNGLTV